MAESDKKILSNIIDYLNKIEERLKTLEVNVSEIKDLELVNKLDIINLKNEIEQIKLIKGVDTSVPSPEEIMRYIEDIGSRLQILENLKQKPKDNVKERICNKCGVVLPENATFCSKCGEKIE